MRWPESGESPGASPSASVNYFNDTNLLKDATIPNCWWVSGGTSPLGEAYRIVVTFTLVFTNGQAVDTGAQGKLGMVRPIPTFTAEIRDEVRVDENNYYYTDTRQPHPPGTYLHFGTSRSPAEDGISFAYANAPLLAGTSNTYGNYFLAQVVDSVTERYNLHTNGVCEAGYV